MEVEGIVATDEYRLSSGADLEHSEFLWLLARL
jgi:hypothetical protein